MEQIFLYNKILSHCTSEFSLIILNGLKIHPLVFHFTKETKKREVPVHQHHFAELSWMVDGNMEYKFDHEIQILSSEKKNFIFIPPETPHQRTSQECDSNILGFLLDFVPQNKSGELFLDTIEKFLAEQNYAFDNFNALREFETKLLKELESGNSIFIGKINFYIYEFLFNFFSYYFADYLIQNSNNRKIFYDRDDLVVAVKQIIEDRLSTSIRLDSLAKKFNVSVRHLTRMFKEQTGYSLGNYISHRKLNTAQKMLYNPKFSVKEIAYSLGFQRDSYFSHFFKKHTGMTPLKYAKQLNKS